MSLIPAKAGTQLSALVELGPGFRRDDAFMNYLIPAFPSLGSEHHLKRPEQHSKTVGWALAHHRHLSLRGHGSKSGGLKPTLQGVWNKAAESTC